MNTFLRNLAIMFLALVSCSYVSANDTKGQNKKTIQLKLSGSKPISRFTTLISFEIYQITINKES